MALYTNLPLDSHAQHLLQMVQYNGSFHRLYEPDFVNLRRCQNTDYQAE